MKKKTLSLSNERGNQEGNSIEKENYFFLLRERDRESLKSPFLSLKRKKRNRKKT